jgi:hypothetical protein
MLKKVRMDMAAHDILNKRVLPVLDRSKTLVKSDCLAKSPSI